MLAIIVFVADLLAIIVFVAHLWLAIAVFVADLLAIIVFVAHLWLAIIVFVADLRAGARLVDYLLLTIIVFVADLRAAVRHIVVPILPLDAIARISTASAPRAIIEIAAIRDTTANAIARSCSDKPSTSMVTLTNSKVMPGAGRCGGRAE